MIGTRENIRLQKAITMIAIILFVVKIVAWFLTGSLAILTDALESIVNIVAGFLGLFSLNLSAKPKDAHHPYGHGKVEFLSAGIKGSLVLSPDFLSFTGRFKVSFIPILLRNSISAYY